MNSYILGKVKKKLLSSAKLYLLIGIEILIGIFVLNTFLTISHSADQKLMELKSSAKSQVINIEVSSPPKPRSSSRDTPSANPLTIEEVFLKSKTPVDPPFDWDEFRIIERELGDNGVISFHIARSLLLKPNESSNITKFKQMYIVFASDKYIELILYLDNINKFDESNTVYMGENFKASLENYSIVDIDFQPFSEINLQKNTVDMRNGQTIFISGMDVFKDRGINSLKLDAFDSIISIDSKDKDGKIINTNQSDKEIDIDDVMILPARYYFDYTLAQEIFKWKIRLRINRTDNYNEILTGVIKGFADATDNGNYIYSPGSEVQEFLNRIDGTQENAYALNLLALSSMIIVTLGLTGLMTIKIIRRKREIAICKTLGAKDVHVFFEVILECVAVTGVFGIIGVFASFYALKNIFNIGDGLYEIVISPGLSVLPVCISVLIGILASIVPLVKVKQSTPVEVLRNL